VVAERHSAGGPEPTSAGRAWRALHRFSRAPAEVAPDEAGERYRRAIDDVGVAVGRPPREAAGLFSDRSYRRLFVAQVTSSTGDWVGFLAIIAITAAAAKKSPDVGVGTVLSARLLPGFFFGSVGGALVDRWDRKKVMVACDVGRGLVVAALPFVHNVPGLFGCSLLLELLTLMWSPAKEASVPNVVAAENLAAANSLSLVAAYGTIVPGALLFTGLTSVANLLAHVHVLRFLRINHESLAIYLDVVTFFVSAALISTIALPRGARGRVAGVAPGNGLRATIDEAGEGWRYIRANTRVKVVILGFCTGLVGGGMVVPLGVTFSAKVLKAGATGFGLLELSLGVGVALGVLALSVSQRHLSHERGFAGAVLGAGVSLLVAASMAHIGLVMLFIAIMGACTGAVYVLGFTILQTNVDDAVRGRVFSVFYTAVRLCLLVALTVAPLLSALLNNLSTRLVNRSVALGSWRIALPGTRLTLWLGGVIVAGAGLVSWRTLHLRGAISEPAVNHKRPG